MQDLIPDYSQAICKELKVVSSLLKDSYTIHTIYFGGGTPSMIPASALGQIFATINQYFSLSANPEITLEANPGTVSAEYMAKLKGMGVNRLSMGMQSAHQSELTLLERQHTFDDVIRSVGWARDAGIANINLDLIFGLPGQSLPSWMTSLEKALSLQPEHLSLYALTLENGTPLQHKVQSGLLSEPDPDLAADMYEAATERLSAANFVQYEISNWARTKNNGQYHACLHNIQYWRNLYYLGIGAGAHGYIDHYRTVNAPNPKAYISRLKKDSSYKSRKSGKFLGTPATIQCITVDKKAEMGETMMMGLRLVQEGVTASEFKQRFGMSLLDAYSHQIEKLISLGLLEWVQSPTLKLRLTTRGRLLGNQVFKEFI